MTDQLLPGASGRRAALNSATNQSGSTNAGLWFDRYYLRDGPDAEAEHKRTLMVAVAGLRAPELYRGAYDRWRTGLPSGCTCAVAEVRGRMVVGTGDKGVAEAGVTLHHTYGVPFIPGSALKGLASAYAHLHLEGDGWRRPPLRPEDPASEQTPHEVLFGSTRSAGFVTFFDALYIPGSADGDHPLTPDVITGHHGDYYVSGTKPPADWDSPVPVPFLTATGRYLIALDGPAGWAAHALSILGMALRDSGIGAKTAAGYGRMRLLDLDGRAIALPEPATQEPHPQQGISAVDAVSSPVSAPSAPSTRSIPGPGAVFAGKVLERGETTIALAVPGHDPRLVLAVLRIADDTPPWRAGDLARVEVVGQEERGGRTVLTVRRAPKAKKS